MMTSITTKSLKRSAYLLLLISAPLSASAGAFSLPGMKAADIAAPAGITLPLPVPARYEGKELNSVVAIDMVITNKNFDTARGKLTATDPKAGASILITQTASNLDSADEYYPLEGSYGGVLTSGEIVRWSEGRQRFYQISNSKDGVFYRLESGRGGSYDYIIYGNFRLDTGLRTSTSMTLVRQSDNSLTVVGDGVNMVLTSGSLKGTIDETLYSKKAALITVLAFLAMVSAE